MVGYGSFAYLLKYNSKEHGYVMGGYICLFCGFLEGIFLRCEIIPDQTSLNHFSLIVPIGEMLFLEQSFLNWKYKTLCFMIARIFVLICNFFYYGKALNALINFIE
jgi:hypothetical protein